MGVTYIQGPHVFQVENFFDVWEYSHYINDFQASTMGRAELVTAVVRNRS